MVDAMKWMMAKGMIDEMPVSGYVAAVSVGKIGEELMLDLFYNEDSNAKVDMNVVMTDKGDFVEIQGTGEEEPFTKDDYNGLIGLAEEGIRELISAQKDTLGN
jgi:ribonuclease PH